MSDADPPYSRTLYSEDLCKLLYSKSKKCVIGSIPVTEFLDTFLPKGNSERPHRFSRPDSSESPLDVIAVLKKLRLQTVEFVDSHSKLNNQTFVMEGLRPSIVVYRNGSQETGTNFERLESWIELVPEADVFDNDGEFMPETGVGTDIVGRLLGYTVAQMTSGFWTHCFSAVVFTDGARLIRWDRAGAIISERFSVTDESNPLIEFCQRLDYITPEQRGHDPSVRTPSDRQRQEACDALRPIRGVNGIEINEETLVEYLVNDATGKTRSFIGPPPKKQVMLLRGRSTRGCPVYDDETKRICYMKDTWRIDSSDLKREGDIYAVLLEKGVHGVAKVVVHGDVNVDHLYTNYGNQVGSDLPQNSSSCSDFNSLHCTQTDKFCEKEWANRPGRRMQGFVHYRLVLDTVGRDLSSFKSSKEALQALIDALTAHGEAYTKARILHQDISLGNIIITENGRGILIDWDFAHTLSDYPPKGFVGTWQFMSGALLQDPSKKIHSYSDDLESFLHVTTSLFLQFSPCNWGKLSIRNYLRKVFEEVDPETEEGMTTRKGGLVKAGELGTCKYISGLEFTGRKELADALREVSFMFRYLYIGAGFGIAEEVLFKGREMLNKYCEGGKHFKAKLNEAMDRADGWQDGPAVPVDLPPTTSEVISFYRKFARMQSLERTRSVDHQPTEHKQEDDAVVIGVNSKRKVNNGNRRSRRRRRLC